MVINQNYKSWYGASKDVIYDAQAFDKIYSAAYQSVINSGTRRDLTKQYLKWVFLINTTLPYYRYFFEYYRPTQKLHVLRFLASHGTYDEKLFTNFIDMISARAKHLDHAEFIEYLNTEVCLSQDPVMNEEHDHFSDLLEVLDFYTKHQMQRSSPGTLLDETIID